MGYMAVFTHQTRARILRSTHPNLLVYVEDKGFKGRFWGASEEDFL